jgi:hypothetical protein
MKKQIIQFLFFCSLISSALQVKPIVIKQEVAHLQNRGISPHRWAKTKGGHVSSFFVVDLKPEKHRGKPSWIGRKKIRKLLSVGSLKSMKTAIK